jgi:hypothetical protein
MGRVCCCWKARLATQGGAAGLGATGLSTRAGCTPRGAAAIRAMYARRAGQAPRAQLLSRKAHVASKPPARCVAADREKAARAMGRKKQGARRRGAARRVDVNGAATWRFHSSGRSAALRRRARLRPQQSVASRFAGCPPSRPCQPACRCPISNCNCYFPLPVHSRCWPPARAGPAPPTQPFTTVPPLGCNTCDAGRPGERRRRRRLRLRGGGQDQQRRQQRPRQHAHLAGEVAPVLAGEQHVGGAHLPRRASGTSGREAAARQAGRWPARGRAGGRAAPAPARARGPGRAQAGGAHLGRHARPLHGRGGLPQVGGLLGEGGRDERRPDGAGRNCGGARARLGHWRASGGWAGARSAAGWRAGGRAGRQASGRRAGGLTRVDADALAHQLLGQRAREGHDGALGGRVVEQLRGGVWGGCRGFGGQGPGGQGLVGGAGGGARGCGQAPAGARTCGMPL